MEIENFEDLRKKEKFMEEYELWLDESGEFENDKKLVHRKMNPSLIGGILFKKGAFSQTQAKKLIGGIAIHSNEENKEDVFERFKRIVKENVIIVEISNKECIRVLDSNITYQNIMAEGLIQIITKLARSNRNRKFHVNILIAQRGDCTNEDKNRKVVSIEQYERRMKERMILEGYEKNIPSECWTIQTADARKDERLMIADTIFKSFLTRNTKFKGEMGEYINRIYEDEDRTWKFSVFETSLANSLNRFLLDGRFGEAVICLCQSENQEFIKTEFIKICEYMANMTYDDIRLQVKIISSRISYYIRITRDYTNCIALIDNMIHYWIPGIRQMKDKWICDAADMIELDLQIQKYTIFTHQGAVAETQRCEKCCDKLMTLNNKMSFEKLEYLLMYTNRKIIHKINLFAFEDALKDSNELVARCEGIKEAVSISEDGIMIAELGKALGTRAQIHMFLIRTHADYYREAEKDALAAKEEFDEISDLKRQDLYLSQIYSEAGQFDEACNILCTGDRKTNLKKWLDESEHDPYKVYAYVRLMAEGKLKGWEQADRLYAEFNQRQIKTDIKADGNKSHPRECIFWKLGTYYANIDNMRAALECYEEALYCYEEKSLTLYVIGYAIELERYAYSLKYQYGDAKTFLKNLKKHYDRFSEKDVPLSIQTIFQNLDFDRKDWEYFFHFSRKVTY